jgi:hypothetical protein
MVHQTMISNIFRQIRKEEHEEALQHEVQQFVMKNQRVILQKTMVKIKCLVGRPKLQPHMTLQSLSNHIKEESKEGTSNQKFKKIKEVLTHNGLHRTFGLTFRVQLGKP